MKICNELHLIINKSKHLKYPFDEENIPLNGIYIIFEEGEEAHGTKRIVRIGTHTGKNQLLSRIKQHFLNENKDRSIFRKNIGRAILKKEGNDYLTTWEIDLTAKKAKEIYGHRVDLKKQGEIEKKVTEYMRSKFSFAVFKIEDKEERLKLESKIISTISLCNDCKPSIDWLGNFSPKEKIKNSGLWLVNELNKEPLTEEELEKLRNIIER